MKEIFLFYIGVYIVDVYKFDKQKSCFFDFLRKLRGVYVDEWIGSNVIFFGDGYTQLYGFVRVEEVFDEFFYFIDGLGSVDIDDGGGQCW